MKTHLNHYGYMKILAWIVILTAWPVFLSAQDYEYTISDGEVTITNYIGEGGDVVIPAELEGIPVATIGELAFYDNHYLTSVTIPESVTSIGRMAFAECYNLTSVIIPETVTLIGDIAFESCRNLTRLTIPASVIYVGSGALTIGMDSKATVYFLGNPPATGSSFGVGPFRGYDTWWSGKVYYIEGTPGWGEELGWHDVLEYIPFTPWGSYIPFFHEQYAYVDTVNWLGYLEISLDPWVWSVDMAQWLYCPGDNVTESGAWVYVSK